MKGSFQEKEGRRNCPDTKKLVWLSAFALLVALSPLFTKLCINGHDLEYHLLRIESLKEGILMGRPFLKVNVLFFGGAGYASSMFYPDFLLYIPALLRALGASINASYHIFVGLCVVLCYLSTYYCGYRLTGSKYAGLITAVIITLCNYHIEDIYVRAAVGEFTAFIFAPFVIYGIYNALYEEADRVYLLGIGYGGVLLCHTGTFVLCLAFGAAAILWSLIAGWIFGRKDKICALGKALGKVIVAAVLTAGLTSFYWLPVMEQLASETFYVSRPWIEPAQEARQFVEIFFSEFPSLGALLILLYVVRIFIPGESDAVTYEDAEQADKVSDSGNAVKNPDIISDSGNAVKNLDIISECPVEKDCVKLLRFADMLFIFGVFFALCSTNFFPWERLGRFMSFMQFPWRFFLMSSICLGFADAILLYFLGSYRLIGKVDAYGFADDTRNRYRGHAVTAVLVLLVFSLSAVRTMEVNTQGYYDYSEDYYSYTPFTANVIAGEWLPVSVEDRGLLLEQSETAMGSDGRPVTFERVKNELRLLPDRELSYIDAPFVYYKGYQAELSEEGQPDQGALGSGTLRPLTVDGSGNNGLVRVYLEPGMKGSILVRYGGTSLQWLSRWISVGSLILILLILFLKLRKAGNIGSVDHRQGTDEGSGKAVSDQKMTGADAENGIRTKAAAEKKTSMAFCSHGRFRFLAVLIGCSGLLSLAVTGCGGTVADRSRPDPESLREIEDLLAGRTVEEEARAEIESYASPELYVRVNGSGFEPESNKSFTVTAVDCEGIPAEELSFSVLCKGEEVYSGTLSERSISADGYDSVPGDRAGDEADNQNENENISWFYGDFTELTDPGEYYISCYIGDLYASNSESFRIEKNFYNNRLTELVLQSERKLSGKGQQSENEPEGSVYTRIADLLLSYEFYEKGTFQAAGQTAILPKSLELAGEYLTGLFTEAEESESGDISSADQSDTEQAQENLSAEVDETTRKYLLSAVSAMYAYDIASFDKAAAKDFGKKAVQLFKEAEKENVNSEKQDTEETSPETEGRLSAFHREAVRYWTAAQLYKYKNDKAYRRLAEELAGSYFGEAEEVVGEQGSGRSKGPGSEGVSDRAGSSMTGFSEDAPAYLGAVAYLTTTNKVDTELSELLMNELLSDAVRTAESVKRGIYWSEEFFTGKASGIYKNNSSEAFDQARLLIFANSVSQSVLYVKSAEELYGYFTAPSENKEPQMFILNGLIHSYITGGNTDWPE
ncbi:MAG: hypothetical protein IJT16_15765 [Lachnospiraceae bacterium]|nr:hypothetical protein [Lachnospiraceae bacterium]